MKLMVRDGVEDWNALLPASAALISITDALLKSMQRIDTGEKKGVYFLL